MDTSTRSESPPLEGIEDDATIKEAAMVMADSGRHHLPVVDREGRAELRFRAAATAKVGNIDVAVRPVAAGGRT